MEIKQFSECLNEYLLENNLTIKQFSEKLGLNVYNVHHWLSCKMNYVPSVYNLIKIADFFACSVDFLIGLEQENYFFKFKTKIAFSKNFRPAVESKGYTLHGLSKAVKISTTCFYKWINEKSEPNIDSIIRIASVLDCTIDYLLGRE